MSTARKLKSGNYNVQVFTGYDENGKKIRKSFTAPTRWEAEKRADEFIKSGKKEEEKITVREAMTNYIATKENVLSPSTINGYKIILRNRLKSIMDIDIHDVNSLNVQMAINEDSKTVGWKSIKEAKSLLSSSLKLYDVNTTLNVPLPPRKPILTELPTAEQIIKAIHGTDVELPCLLAMWLSLRISEVRGLQFRDIKNDVLTIRRSNVCVKGKDNLREINKTYNSTRQLTLPKYIKSMIDELPRKSDTDFIVPMDYQTICRHFKKNLEVYGLSMNFHDLRHMNASIMLKLGIPDKYAMERGGWSTNSTLKAVYQHTFSDERKIVDDKIDDYFNALIEE